MMDIMIPSHDRAQDPQTPLPSPVPAHVLFACTRGVCACIAM